MLAILNYLRWLSLDVVAGSIVLLHFLNDLFDVPGDTSVYFELGVSIWLIYTIDHLSDVRALESPSLMRHKFHKENESTLRLMCALGLLLATVNLFFLPVTILWSGLLIAGCCLGYLILAQFLGTKGYKEVIIAVLFSAGICLYPFTYSSFPLEVSGVLLQLGLLAFLNLNIIAFYEYEEDKRDRFPSLVRKIGRVRATRIMTLLFMLSFGFATTFSLMGISPAFQVFATISTAILAVIAYYPKMFRLNSHYQLVSDGIFFIPLLLL